MAGENTTYDEREAVAVFSSEASLNAAVDALLQIGLQQEDMSLLGSMESLPGGGVKALEDSPDAPRANYVSPDARTEGKAAAVSAPIYVGGAGAAVLVASGTAALLPCLAVAGAAAAVGGIGLMISRAVGRKHAARVQQQLLDGGLLLWVHLGEKTDSAKVLDILQQNGGQDAHVHTITKSWGTDDVPLSTWQPDPLLKA